MKTYCLLVLVIAVAASATASSAVEGRHQKEVQEHYNHVSYVVENSCRQPQPKIVTIQQLVPLHKFLKKEFYPPFTVLYRCDKSSGCCEEPMTCGHLHAEVVRLPFNVTYMPDRFHNHEGKWEIEYITAVNHTICGCTHDVGPQLPRWRPASTTGLTPFRPEHDHRDQLKPTEESTTAPTTSPGAAQRKSSLVD